jgi:hypothetical protein
VRQRLVRQSSGRLLATSPDDRNIRDERPGVEDALSAGWTWPRAMTFVDQADGPLAFTVAGLGDPIGLGAWPRPSH